MTMHYHIAQLSSVSVSNYMKINSITVKTNTLKPAENGETAGLPLVDRPDDILKSTSVTCYINKGTVPRKSMWALNIHFS